MGTEDKKGEMVKTTDVAFSIIETLRSRDGARVTEIANEMGKAKSTIHRHLSTLESLDYVVKEGDEYNVGLKFFTIGEYARNRKKDHEMIRPKVAELAEVTDERAQFMVEEHGKAVYIYRETGSKGVQSPNSGVGQRIPIHVTSVGKAILAEFPDEKIHEIIQQQGLPALTDQTITDMEELFNEINITRERGYGVNFEESSEKIRAVGVAITSPEGCPIGGLSISGPSHRMKGHVVEEEIPDLLLGTANELELNIAYS